MNTQTTLIKNAEEILQKLHLEQDFKLPPKTYLGVQPDLESYKRVLAYTTAASKAERTRDPEDTAVKLLAIFETAEESIDYLLSAFKQFPGSRQPLHDACLFTLPEEAMAEDRLALWRGFTRRFNQKLQYRSILATMGDMEAAREKNPRAAENPEFIALKQKETKLFNERKAVKKRLKEIKDHLVLLQALPTEVGEEDQSSNMSYVEALQDELHLLMQRDKNIKQELAETHYAKACMIIDENSSLATLTSLAHRLRYKRYDENPEAAELFIKYFVPEEKFNRYLELMIENQKRDEADAELSLKPPSFFSRIAALSKDEALPTISIDGAELGYPGFYFTKLDKNDPRGAVLGDLTGCCQSIHGIGKKYCEYGLTDPCAGFYVLCKGDFHHPSKEDRIYAQSLTWRIRGSIASHISLYLQTLVFDTIEHPKIFSRAEDIERIKAFYDEAARIMIRDQSIQFVCVGTGGQTPNRIGFELTHGHELHRYAPNFLAHDSEYIRALAIQSEPEHNYIHQIDIAEQVYRGKFDPAILDSIDSDYCRQEIQKHVFYVAVLTKQFNLCKKLISKNQGVDPRKPFRGAEGLIALGIKKSDPEILQFALSVGCSFSDSIGRDEKFKAISAKRFLLDIRKKEPSREIMQIFIEAEGLGVLFEKLNPDHPLEADEKQVDEDEIIGLGCFIENNWVETLSFILENYPTIIPFLNIKMGPYTFLEMVGLYQYKHQGIQKTLEAYPIDPENTYLYTPLKEPGWFLFLAVGVQSTQSIPLYLGAGEVGETPNFETEEIELRRIGAIETQSNETLICKFKITLKANNTTVFSELLDEVNKEQPTNQQLILDILAWTLEEQSFNCLRILLTKFSSITLPHVLTQATKKLPDHMLVTCLDVYRTIRSNLEPGEEFYLSNHAMTRLLLTAYLDNRSELVDMLIQQVIGQVMERGDRFEVEKYDTDHDRAIFMLIERLYRFIGQDDAFSQEKMEPIIEKIIINYPQYINICLCIDLFKDSTLLSERISDLMISSPNWAILFYKYLSCKDNLILFDAFFNEHKDKFLAVDFKNFCPGKGKHFKAFVSHLLEILPQQNHNELAKKLQSFIEQTENDHNLYGKFLKHDQQKEIQAVFSEAQELDSTVFKH